jgi:hypothetical protein
VRRTLIAVAAPLVLFLLVLMRVVWWVGSQPARENEGLTAQAGLLVAAFQAVLAFCLTLVTLYYALVSSQMLRIAQMNAQRSDHAVVRAAVERVTGAAIAALTSCGIMAHMLERDWRWYLPHRVAARNAFLLQQFPILAAEVKQVAQAAESLKLVSLELAVPVEQLSGNVVDAFTAATSGRPRDVEAIALRVREVSEVLRECVRPPVSATDSHRGK